jgi:hypothetical protein
VKIYLKDKYGRKEITDYVISGNMLTWTFYGKNQRRTGAYSLELVVNENENGMITTDACQFVNLVHCSCDVAGSDDNGVSTETIELRSQLSVGGSSGEGGGSYDDTAIWKAVNNKVDKVAGKGLSTNDYTNAEKSKLAGLKNYDDTKLKEEIAKTYATKEYVDEAVANAGGGGEGGGSYDDTAVWAALNNKVDKVAGKGLSSNDYTTADKLKLSGLKNYDDTELKSAITGLEQSKANKPILISIEALGTPAAEDEVAYWSKEQVEAALSMTLSELYEQAQTREVLVNIMGQTLYPESTMRLEDDLIEFRYSIPTPAVSGFYVLVIRQSPTDVEGVNTAIMLGGQFEELATKEELTELSAEVGKLSEKVENLPTAESSVFEAVYGVTTYDEIKAANDEGKIVVARHENSIYRLSALKAYEAVLFASEANNSYTLKCSNKNAWSGAAIVNTHDLKTLDNGNAEITIAGKTAEVVTPQYVENLLGVIINGDY